MAVGFQTWKSTVFELSCIRSNVRVKLSFDDIAVCHFDGDDRIFLFCHCLSPFSSDTTAGSENRFSSSAGCVFILFLLQPSRNLPAADYPILYRAWPRMSTIFHGNILSLCHTAAVSIRSGALGNSGKLPLSLRVTAKGRGLRGTRSLN